MFIVAAVDRNWAIGKNGNLLYRIPADMVNFREITTGKTIVYGRKTLKTFPGKKPLKNRENLILTHDADFSCDGATIIHDITDLDNYPSNDLYVIGGASIYQQLFQKCKYALITYIDSVTLDSDAFFPDLSQLTNWEILYETSYLHYQGLPYKYVTYVNSAVD
jgi:dihydrofolate reductase